jgi:hypothetical protein
MLTRNNGQVSGSSGGIPRPRVRGGHAGGPEAPPPDTVVTAEMIAFKNASLAQPESDHSAMAADEAQRREMVLLTGTLAPRASATHVAIQNGNWTTASTWLNAATDQFEVPTAGARILIPETIAVTMNNNTTTAYQWIRHDGTLEFVTNANTQLFVDTIVSDHHSVWRQGTVASPITSAYTSTVTFPDGGDLNPAVDALLIGRGWVSMGDVFVHGASKVPFVTSHQVRAAGNTTIVVNETPTGWAVGDEITIGGTECGGWVGGWDGTRAPTLVPLKCDHVTITNISGTTITFTPGLTYARTLAAPRADADFTDAVYYIGNYTRNITFRSPPGTAIHRRAHIMWMHSEIDARWAASNLIGRTRKDVVSFDATNDAARIANRGSDIPWLATSNVRGRYNWHVHRAGVGGVQPTAVMTGLAASDAPGWIYAHHSSRANFTDCVGRRFVGVGLMAEAGNEIGTWTGCLMQAGVSPLNPSTVSTEKQGDLVNSGEFGVHGSAYWGRSRVVQIINCVATDCDNFAAWLSRTPVSGPGVILAPPVSDIDLQKPFYAGATVSDLISADHPVLVVKGARIVACRAGLIVVKAGPQQAHTHRSIFWDIKLVNSNVMTELDYTGKYTFQKIRLWRSDVRDGNNAPIFLSQGSVDMVFNDVAFKNMTGKSVFVNSGNIQTAGPNWDHTFINCNFPVSTGGTYGPFVLTGNGSSVATYETKTIILGSGAIQVRPITLTALPEPVFSTSPFAMVGTVTDSIRIKDRAYYRDPGNDSNGVYAFINLNQLRSMLSRDGYWTYTHPVHGASRYLLVPDMLTDTLPDTSGNYQLRYLTIVLRVTGQDSWMTTAGVVNNGALPTRYVDAITAATYVVYETNPEGVS